VLLQQRESQQREAVARAATRLRAAESSLEERPQGAEAARLSAEAARLSAELERVLAWAAQWSRDVVSKVSTQARSLELLAMDLQSVSAATGLSPWSAAEQEAGRHQLLGVARALQRARTLADGAVASYR
jgi:hypothetical protein